jgi:flagellar biosynthetic protein FliR
MSTLLTQYQHQFLIFLLVLTRIAGLISTAPVFGSQSAPLRIRGLLAVALAILTAPIYLDIPFELPSNLMQLGALMLAEASLGAILGIGVMILFSGVMIVGQIAGQMSGMQLANAVDPNFQENTPLFGQLLNLIATASFLCIGGHRQLLAALLDTFAWMPPGHASFPTGAVAAIMEMVSQSFLLGVRAGAPIMASLTIAIIVMGLLSRTLPQLNIIAVGFSLNTMVMLGVLMLTVASTVLIFQSHVEPTFDLIREMIIPIDS